jgi:DivIVA domain-containing protein
MCRVRAIASLRSFGWCSVHTPVLLVACSLAPWPAPRLPSFSFFVVDPDGDWNLPWSLLAFQLCVVGFVLAPTALQARIRFSGLLRRPSDPHTATVMASKRGGRTVALDINPGGYQPLSEVRLALWTKAEMLMPGESVTVYGRPGGKNPLLISSPQRGRAFLGTEMSRSTVGPGPLDEKVSGATLVDWAAWAASTTFSSTGLKSGYDKHEVDAFRSAVRDTFLGGAVFWVSTPPVRSDDLRGKQFSTHRPGYDKSQVDAFLEATRLRLAAMEASDRPLGPLVNSAILAGWAEWADSTTFSYGGYAADEVDAFRRAIRDTFRGLREPPVTSGDVHGKQFPSTDNVPGYDKAQVDAFLEAAGIRLAAMESTDRPEEPPVSGTILADGSSGPTQQGFQPPRWAEWAEWADSTRFSTTPEGRATIQRRSTRTDKRFATRSSGSGNPPSHRMRPTTSGSDLPGGAATTSTRLTPSVMKPNRGWLRCNAATSEGPDSRRPTQA